MTLLLVPVLAAGLSACRRGDDAETRRRTATVAEALRPAFFAAALGRLGGGHLHATARFGAGPDGPSDGVTTTTDLWLDRQGSYRLVELNDRDGGREVIRTGRELAVALRYGKMIRRPAEEPEPTRLLEEALGAPEAAWEVVAPAATVARAGSETIGGARATTYVLGLAPAGASAARPANPTGARPTGLRAWRGTVSVSALAGGVAIDDATGAVMRADIKASFTLTQEGRPLRGEAEVHAALSDVGAVAPIERPVAEDLALRQRLIPEQKELLGGLPSTRMGDEPTTKQQRRARP
jgi:hypothetical protein